VSMGITGLSMNLLQMHVREECLHSNLKLVVYLKEMFGTMLLVDSSRSLIRIWISKCVFISIFLFSYISFFFFIFFSIGVLLMDELQQAVAPFLHASGGGVEGFNPPPAPSDNSVFICTDEPAQEVGEVPQRAPRERVRQAAFDDSREMRFAEKHAQACDKRIQEIVGRAKALYASGGLDLNIKEEADIERGVQSFFADLYRFDTHQSRVEHIKRVFSAIGNQRSPIWQKMKDLIEN
jgi:hypothetical protein